MRAEIEKLPTFGLLAKIYHKDGVDVVTSNSVMFDTNGVVEEYPSRWGALIYLRIVELLPNEVYFPILRRGLKKYLQFVYGKRSFIKDKEVAFLVAFLLNAR